MYGDLADADEKSICGKKVEIDNLVYSLARMPSEIRGDNELTRYISLFCI